MTTGLRVMSLPTLAWLFTYSVQWFLNPQTFVWRCVSGGLSSLLCSTEQTMCLLFHRFSNYDNSVLFLLYYAIFRSFPDLSSTPLYRPVNRNLQIIFKYFRKIRNFQRNYLLLLGMKKILNSVNYCVSCCI